MMFRFGLKMAKGARGRSRIASRQYRSTPYPLPSFNQAVLEDMLPKKCSRFLEKKGWEDATCSVCMECPHNAVLLLCSSHDKGCRPYMCGTSFRYSNCLDQYKKAYAKVKPVLHEQTSQGTVDDTIAGSVSNWSIERCEVSELACPLCRGQVKGWTIFEPAREFLNEKKRSCMQDNCSFIGTYKELRKHMKAQHPCARPREVDPTLERKWRRLEHEREREDVISTIRSTMPGAMVFGDYVIEGSHYGLDTDEDDLLDGDVIESNEGFEVGMGSNLVNVFLLLHAFGPAAQNRGMMRRHGRDLERHSSPVEGFVPSDQGFDSDDDNGGMSLVTRLRRQGRVLLGRSGRRRRHREASGSQR